MIRKLLTLLPPVSLKITDTLYSVVVSIGMQIVLFDHLLPHFFQKFGQSLLTCHLGISHTMAWLPKVKEKLLSQGKFALIFDQVREKYNHN